MTVVLAGPRGVRGAHAVEVPWPDGVWHPSITATDPLADVDVVYERTDFFLDGLRIYRSAS